MLYWQVFSKFWLSLRKTYFVNVVSCTIVPYTSLHATHCYEILWTKLWRSFQIHAQMWVLLIYCWNGSTESINNMSNESSLPLLYKTWRCHFSFLMLSKLSALELSYPHICTYLSGRWTKKSFRKKEHNSLQNLFWTPTSFILQRNKHGATKAVPFGKRDLLKWRKSWRCT